MGFSAGAIRAGSAFVELFTKDIRLVAGLRSAERRLQAFGASMTAMGSRIAGLGIAMAAPLAGATRTFASFDDQMRKVRAFGSMTAGEFQHLTTVAQQLGASTSFTAIQVGELMAELARAGFSATNIEQATAAILNLSRATDTAPARSAEIVANVLGQFNLTAADTVRIVDMLTTTANRTFTDVNDLGEALSYAGTSAAAAGQSLEDTLAILGSLGNVGIRGSNAGTALRRLVMMTASESERLREIFGVTATDASGNLRPLVQVLGEVQESIRNLGGAERAAKLNEFFGLLGVTAAGVVGQNVGSIQELSEEIRNSGGTAQRAARDMDAGLGGAMRRMNSAVEGAAIAIGESLSPVLTAAGHVLTSVITSTREWVLANQDTVIAIGLGVAAFITLGTALIGIGVAFKLAAFAVGIFAAAVKLAYVVIMAPWALILVAVQAATGAVSAFFSFLANTGPVQTFSQGMAAVAETAQTTFAGVLEAIRGGDLEGAGRIAMAGLRAAWAQGVETLRNSWNEFTTWFGETWAGKLTTAVGSVLSTMDNALGRIRGMVDAGHSGSLTGIGAEYGVGTRGVNPRTSPMGPEIPQAERLRRELQSTIEASRAARQAEPLRLAQNAGMQMAMAMAFGLGPGGVGNQANVTRNLANAQQQVAGKVDTAATFKGGAAGGLEFGTTLRDQMRQQTDVLTRIERNTRNGGGFT